MFYIAAVYRQDLGSVKPKVIGDIQGMT